MLRRNLRHIALCAAGLAIALYGTAEANAFWGHGSGGSGGSGGYASSGGSYGGYASYGSDGSYGSYGSHGGGRFQRRAWRRAARHAYYHSSGGSYGDWGYAGYGYGSYGSSGGSYGSYGSYGSHGSSGGSYGSYSSYGSHGSTGGMIIEETEVHEEGAADDTDPRDTDDSPSDATPEPNGDEPAENDSTRLPSLRSAAFSVRVPEGTKVFVNDLPTTSTGEVRRFVSNGLEPGYAYNYELRAELVRDGRTITDSKSVRVKAGDVVAVEFNLDDKSTPDSVAKEPTRTRLILRVPADAKVYLSGQATRSFGPVREFTTTRLAPGEKWEGYTVRVELDRDGQTLSDEETLTLVGGDSRELSIDLEAPKFARAGR